jgi:hypothetical protein
MTKETRGQAGGGQIQKYPMSEYAIYKMRKNHD